MGLPAQTDADEADVAADKRAWTGCRSRCASMASRTRWDRTAIFWKASEKAQYTLVTSSLP